MKFPSYRLGPIGKANIGVVVVSLLGIYGFVLAKNQVDKDRYAHMKARQQMLRSNSGFYEPGSGST